MKLKELHEEVEAGIKVEIPDSCDLAKRTQKQKQAVIEGVDEQDGSFVQNQTIFTIEYIKVEGNTVTFFPMDDSDIKNKASIKKFKERFNGWCYDQDFIYTHMFLKKLPAAVKGKNYIGDFLCDYNELTTFENSPETVQGSVSCTYNSFTSLKDIHKHIKGITETLYCTKNPIESNVLGLLKIKHLKKVVMDNRKVESIINKYLPEGDILDCATELEDAGFEEYAKL